jgi:hypothetical protein
MAPLAATTHLGPTDSKESTNYLVLSEVTRDLRQELGSEDRASEAVGA